MWPCLDEQKGHVLKFCWINSVNFIKKLSQLSYTLARSLVLSANCQLTPTCTTADCIGCEGLQRAAVIIWLKKMSFLQPSLSGHGALQGMAGTFATTSLACSEHRLSSMASLACKRRGNAWQTHFESWLQSHLAQDRTPLYTDAASGPQVNWHFCHWF